MLSRLKLDQLQTKIVDEFTTERTYQRIKPCFRIPGSERFKKSGSIGTNGSAERNGQVFPKGSVCHWQKQKSLAH